MKKLLPPIWLLVLLALLATAGCNEEDCATCLDPCGEASLVVMTDPAAIDITWTMTRSDGFYFRGRGAYEFTDIAPGEYRFTWSPTPYYASTGPDTLSVTIAAGAADTIRGVFEPVTSPVRIEIIGPPEGAPWELEHILGATWSGVGDTTLADVMVGPCTIIWGDVDGWHGPNYTGFINDPADTTVVTVTYLGPPPFPDSEDQLIDNMRFVHEEMEFEYYPDLLHPDYAMLLQPQTQEEFPNVGPTLDYAEEVDIAQKMFSGSAIINSQNELVPGIASINFATFARQGEWATSPGNDVIPNARFAMFETLIYHDRGAASTLRVEGLVKMYVSSRDSTEGGVTRPYFQLIGIQDLTGGLAAGKAVEQHSWGSVKALFR